MIGFRQLPWRHGNFVPRRRWRRCGGPRRSSRAGVRAPGNAGSSPRSTIGCSPISALLGSRSRECAKPFWRA